MNPLNSILLEGNVVRPTSIRETAKGTNVCTFTIASNRSYRSDSGTFDKEVSFFDIETWGQLAVICGQQCVKGRGVRVVGRLKQGRWKDDNGKTHSKITVIAEHLEFKPVFHKDDEKLVELEEKQLQAQDEENRTERIIVAQENADGENLEELQVAEPEAIEAEPVF